MGIFNIFRKKQEIANNSDQVLQKIERKVEKKSEQTVVAKKYSLNPLVTVKEKSPMHEVWSIYSSENNKTGSFQPLQLIEKTIIKAKKDSDVPENSDKLDKIEEELLKFIQEIHKHCQGIFVKLKTEQTASEKVKRNSEADSVHKPIAATPLLYMTKDKVRLWVVIIPPLYGGANITAEGLMSKLSEMSVKYGIDREMLNTIIHEKCYLQIAEIALGKPAIDGKDGSIENLFSRSRNKINIKEDTHGNVNYKELNMIQSVHKGDVICEIIPPTLSIDGKAVTGEVVKGKDGKNPVIPNGKNTVISEDQTCLLADIDGEVVYEEKKFKVINLLTINHDVDNSIGNIDFAGDVLIKGDVREGYTVKADGNIRIIGTVEGSTVIAGGNLIIDRGMTGGSKGIIETKGTLKCKYLENCRVYAKCGIEAHQIMYCDLSTDESIIVDGTKGSVTGGKLIAGVSVEAVTIGAITNDRLKTEIVIGVVPHLVEQETDTQAQLDNAEKELHRYEQDINYIESNINEVSEERKNLLGNLKFQHQILEVQITKLMGKLSDIKQKIQSNTEKCSLKCQTIYPILCLNVCGSTYTVDTELKSCKVSRKDDETYISSTSLTEKIVF